ncbi:hypothetical protein CJI97_004066 [Candidozyma auris]|nr:hypothetical protein CJI97_004066 [[Candida] auris]
MSSILDKSLDDIISTRKSQRSQGKKKAVGKGTGKAQKKETVSFKKAAKKVAPQPKPALDLTYATKVVAQGLPRDLKQDAIKEFFQSQIGGVSVVSMNYNEKGQFRGGATIIFKSHKNAVKAVEKYNNAPIDGGSSKLKMELVIDPTKKPLAARITANKTEPVATPQQKKQQVLKQKVQQKRQQLQKKASNGKPKKQTKKTAEQLDQEMSDYFNNN